MSRSLGTHTGNILMFALMIAIMLMAVSCGGVQRNPAAPNFGPNTTGEQGLPGKGDQETGKTGDQEQGKAKAWGAGQILEGDYDTLIAQAETSLETGDLQMAYNSYFSALAQKPGDSQAGFGMALVQLARNWRTFSIFTGAGSDKMFYGTPLALHHEMLPNPVSSEDSYLLRVFTIGRKYEENFARNLPSWSTEFFKAEPVTGDEGPVVSPPGGPEGMTKFPTPSDGDEGGLQPPIDGGEKGDEEAPPDGDKPTPQPPSDGEDSDGNWPANWKPLSNGDEKEFVDEDDPAVIEEQLNLDSNFGGIEGKPHFSELPGLLAEGTTPIDADYFQQEIGLTRKAMLADSAGIRMDSMIAQNLVELNGNLDGVISLLEGISDEVNDDFDFQLGLVMRGKTEKYRIIFKQADYDLLLAELEILTGIAKFVNAYEQQAGYIYYYTQAADLDTDSMILPAEYYPPAPYGMLKENGEDLLDDARELLLQGYEDAENAWDLILSRAYDASVETTNEMLAISAGGVQLAVLEGQKDLYREFSSNFDDTFDTTLDSSGSLLGVEVHPSVLFDGSIGDIRGFLPCLDTSGTITPCSEDGLILPDATFGGLFPEGLEDESTLLKAGTLSGYISNNTMQFIENGKISYFGGEETIKEDGSFTLSGVEFNELTGLYLSVSFGEGLTWEGVIRSLNENISTVESVPFTPGLGMPTGPEGIYDTGNDGTGAPRPTPGDGTGMTPG